MEEKRFKESTLRYFVLRAYGASPFLEMKQSSLPDLGEDDVLIEVSYSSVNDYDWALSTGKPLLYRFLFGFNRPKLKPGMEMSGVVKKLGRKLKNLHVGDRVCGDLSDDRFGSFANYVVAKEKSITKIPDNLTLEEAATLPHAGLLAQQGIELLGRKECEKILINGAGGGVGTLALQILKKDGVQIDGIDTGKKLKDMQQLGFDNAFDYKKSNLRKLDEKYDFILDTKSKFWPWDYVRRLKKNGVYITVGGNLPNLISILILKGLTKFLTKKTLKILVLKPNVGLNKLITSYVKGSMKSVIDGPYPFESAANALVKFGHGKHSGKVLLKLRNE